MCIKFNPTYTFSFLIYLAWTISAETTFIFFFKRYPPKYFKKEDECSLCTYGPCKIDEKRKGVCGIELNAHLSRMSLFTAVTGAAGHASLAESITSELIEKFGSDYPLELNDEPLQTPLIRLICGFKPK